MYINSSSDILISCGGGELMCETLEYVDFDKIKNSPPKWYLGYSDNTNFTFYRQYLTIQHLFMVCVQVHLA